MHFSKSHTLDMTHGAPAPLILRFALPIFLSSLFQQMYNLADIAIAGHVLGDAALAEIGATAALYSLLLGFAFGLNTGFALLASRAFGAGDSEGLRRASGWMTLLAAAWSAALTAGCLAALPWLMRLLNTPPETLAGALAYIRIILAGIPLTMAYNLESSLLRSVGNSAVPLGFLILSSVLNVVLDVLFMARLGLGVRGAALATVAAQGVSAALCFVYILRCHGELRFTRRHLQTERGYVSGMLLTGLSMALMSTIYSIGSVALQGAINALGSVYITAQIAGRRLVELFMMPQSAISTACATYTSQNYGAGQRRRILRGIVITCALCFAWDAVGTLFAFTLAKPAAALITGSADAEMLRYALLYIRISLPMFPPMAVLIVLRNALQGMNHRVAPLLCSSIELIGKLIFSAWVVPTIGYAAVCACEPVTWVACCVFIVAAAWHWRAELRDENEV